MSVDSWVICLEIDGLPLSD